MTRGTVLIEIHVKDREGEEHTIEAGPDDRLMEVLREYEWGVSAICGGMCSCATCHVWVDESWLDRFPPRDIDELELLEFLDEFRPNSRLSCQLVLQPQHDGLTVELAPEE